MLPDPESFLVETWKQEQNESEIFESFDQNYRNVKVLFFDIDETMVHCIDDRDPSTMVGQYRLTIGLDSHQTQQAHSCQSDSEMPESIEIDINFRPGLIECLNDLKNSYQLVSFTASD